MFSEAASDSFDEDAVDVLTGLEGFLDLVLEGFLLFALSWMLSPVFRPRVPQSPVPGWPQAPYAPPPAA